MTSVLSDSAQALGTLTPGQWTAAFALLLGALIVVMGLGRLFFEELKRRDLGDPPRESSDGEAPRFEVREGPGKPTSAVLGFSRRTWLFLGLVTLIVLVGSWLRLHGLDVKTLSHTEAIVPNLEWPPNITWPPARHSFYDTFWWHFHGEGHPQAYYFLMWAWTHVFGTELFTLRLPSVLFGIGCIPLVYALGVRVYNRRVGALAAGLVAFNGLHIYFSQYARLFMMGTFLALLSTLLLLKASDRSKRSLYWEAGYVLVSSAAVYTQTFFWVVLATQILWVVLQKRLAAPSIRRLLTLQALIVALGSASLAHVIYRGDDVDLPGPSLAFLAHYLSFGFILRPDELSIPARTIPWVATGLITVLGGVLTVLGLRVSARGAVARHEVRPLPSGPVLWVALGSSSIVAGLTVVALRHQPAMAPVALLPFLALAAVPLGLRIHRRAREIEAPSLVALLAVVPAVVVFVLSFWTSMLIPRAFLMFVPYLLLVIAAGTSSLFSRRGLTMLVAGVLIVLHAASVAHYREFPNDAIDYRGIGEGLNDRLRTGDLVFVVPESWFVTAIFYYLEARGQLYVANDYAAEVGRHPDARVWLLYFDSARWGPYPSVTAEMLEAVEHLRAVDEVTSRRARAVLHVNPP